MRARAKDRPKSARADRCWYCGRKMSNDPHAANGRTRDHQTPKSRGGRFLPNNRVDCCRACNQEKADRTLEEYRTARSVELGEMVTFHGENVDARE